MAKKRKSRAVEAPEDPEPAQTIEPEPELELEQEETERIHEQQQQQQQQQQEEEQEQQPNDMEEDKNENNGQQHEITDKPSADAATNGGEEAKEQDDGVEGKEEEEEDIDLEEEPLEKLLEPFTKDQLTLLIREAVLKHPDVVHNVHKLADADPAHRKIFVHGLGWEATADTITGVYGKYGEIEDCRVVKDKISGKSKGYGFILFKHRDGARRALKQPQKLIEGRMTSCQLASAGPVPSPAVATVSSSLVSEYTQRKIYVTNVSAELDPRKLCEFFSKFGEIEEGPLGLDKQTGKPRGFCLFVYKSVESAMKALEEPHKNYEGQILHCQKAVDGPRHNKGGYFQQHGQSQQHHNQVYYHHPAKKGRYAGSSGGVGHTGGHLMAPSAGPPMPSGGFNPAVAPAALGQAVAALLASQGGGLGIGNLFGGIGAGMNAQGVPPMMNNAGYGGHASAGGYGGQPGVQGGYGGQPQLGQSGVRPYQGGPPYMGHRH